MFNCDKTCPCPVPLQLLQAQMIVTYSDVTVVTLVTLVTIIFFPSHDVFQGGTSRIRLLRCQFQWTGTFCLDLRAGMIDMWDEVTSRMHLYNPLHTFTYNNFWVLEFWPHSDSGSFEFWWLFILFWSLDTQLWKSDDPTGLGILGGSKLSTLQLGMHDIYGS
jgi:hypothetical protein